VIRRPTVRVLLAAAIGAFVPALTAATADASLSIASFSITPSTTQAGGTLDRPGPNLTIDASFSSRDGDTPRNATVSLAPGLLANPSGIPVCPASAFQAGACPDDSRIGTGTITGTAPQFAFTLTLPTDAYLVQPQGSEPARIGLIASFFDYPVATQSAPVTIRTRPDVGLDIPLTGLPNDVDGVPVKIDGLHLTIFGAVDGHPFTRNPTSCSQATSSLTVDSYGAPSATQTQQSSFTPTGCGNLPYSPTIAGTVAKDGSDNGVAITATITQQYDESDDRAIDLTLPRSASPRLSALSQACSNADLTTCPPIGTAQVKTPLLTHALTAPIVLVAHPGEIPTLAILIPQPIGLELDATPVLTGDAVRAIVMNIPDVPIESLALTLPGGQSSLFRAGVHLCRAAQSFSAALTGWSGATANPVAAASVTGCPATAPAIATAGRTPHATTPAKRRNRHHHRRHHRRHRAARRP
jgi:hypothetical protein